LRPSRVLGDILGQTSKMSMFFDKHSPVGPVTGLAAARNIYQGRIIPFLMALSYCLRESSAAARSCRRISGRRYG
jgi:hypothetical protein